MPRGRPFQKGCKRHPDAGRKTGTPNRLTRKIKDFIDEVCDDQEVQEAFRQQLIDRKPNAVSGFLGIISHKIGRPKETVEVNASPSLARLLLLAGEVKGKEEPTGVQEKPGEGDA